jgi:hypothetical protein
MLILRNKIEYNCTLNASEFLFQFIKHCIGFYCYFQDDMFWPIMLGHFQVNYT